MSEGLNSVFSDSNCTIALLIENIINSVQNIGKRRQYDHDQVGGYNIIVPMYNVKIHIMDTHRMILL